MHRVMNNVSGFAIGAIILSSAAILCCCIVMYVLFLIH